MPRIDPHKLYIPTTGPRKLWMIRRSASWISPWLTLYRPYPWKVSHRSIFASWSGSHKPRTSAPKILFSLPELCCRHMVELIRIVSQKYGWGYQNCVKTDRIMVEVTRIVLRVIITSATRKRPWDMSHAQAHIYFSAGPTAVFFSVPEESGCSTYQSLEKQIN